MKVSFLRKIRTVLFALLRILTRQEKIAASILIVVMVVSGFLTVLPTGGKLSVTGGIQPISGGLIIEGMVGRPEFINPVLAKSELDKSLTSLVYAGLMQMNEKQEIVPDLAARFEVSEDKKIYTLYLKPGLTWQDGKALDADDVMYTVAVLQNPDYNGALKATWEGIRAEKVDQLTVKFGLPRAYPLFLNALTVGLLPWHLWADVKVSDFPTYPLNTKPVGAGAYQVNTINQDKEGKIVTMELTAFSKRQPHAPYISRFDIRFYNERSDLVKGLAKREISSAGLFSFDDALAGDNLRGYTNHVVSLPQYVGLFFNLKKPGGSYVTDHAVREAVAGALDRETLRAAANFSAGTVIDSPILQGYIGHSDDVKKYAQDVKTSQSLLSQAGWNDADSNGIREKDGHDLSLLLAIPQDEQFVRVADELTRQLQVIGVRLDVRKGTAQEFEQQYLATRAYDMVLIGENVGLDADPYSYWHSSQSNYPGLNLSMFENGEVDKLLEEARQTTDTNLKIRDYQKFQQIIAQELPAIMLYQPVYVYKVSNQVKGIGIAGITNTWDRFASVVNWYINTK
ncbi:MAG: ABC transporter substrate-binding protein [Patescibacteria group bacterium]